MTDAQRVTPEYMMAWGTHAHGSPLYRHLVSLIATTPDLMRLMNRIENQPPPNVLLAGVQYLLRKSPSQPLGEFYPNLVDEARPVEEVDRPFIDFVTAHEDQLIEIGRTRLTQTNECRRCAILLPGVVRAPFDSFHLIDVGTSAGLNLAIDRYHYRYGDATWGPESRVRLAAENRGADLDLQGFTVLSRTGIDLNPIDASDQDQRLWLEALIWPEHDERRLRLSAALDLMTTIDIEIVAGDALEVLPAILAGLPAGEPAVVMNSFVLIQFSEARREEYSRVLAQGRQERQIHRVSFEAIVKGREWAYLSVDDGTGLVEIGRAHPHGEWIELYG